MQTRFSQTLLLAAVSLFVVSCAATRQAQWDATPTQTTSSTDSFEALVAQGEAQWNNRADQKALEAAIAQWEKALAVKDDAGLWARLSRAYYFLSDGHLRKEGDKSPAYLATFEKGVAAGERALAASNAEFKKAVVAGKRVEEAISLVGVESVDAAYWYATNLGKWARAKGFATQLGNKDRIKAVMDRILALDPNYFHGAAHRYFGAFYGVAPSFAGGDLNKSKEHFDKSLSLAPNYVGTKVLYAEIYATKKQDKALFTKLLDEVLAVQDNVVPGLEAEIKNEKDKAAELKSKVAELF